MDKKINTDEVKKFVKDEVGVCPICGSGNLEYGSLSQEDESIYYDWECKSCGASGQEWCDVVFSTHGNVIKANGEHIKNDSGY